MQHDDPTAALLAMEELNRRIIEAMPGGIVHVAANGAIYTANAEACRILGLSYDKLVGRYTSDFEPETVLEDGTPCSLEQYPVTRALRTGEAQAPMTIGVRSPNGEMSWAVFTAVPLRSSTDDETIGAVVTFLDITERKRREEERLRLERQLMASERLASIGTLAAGVAHEINNPLSYVILCLDAINAEYAGLSAGLGRRVVEALDGATRIRDIVRDLRAHSKSEEGTEVVRIEELLRSSLRMCGQELRQRAHVHFDFHHLRGVKANRSRLGQVFLNIIVNSLQATPEAGDHNLYITAHSQGAEMHITIRDEGSGIAADLLPRIFEPFVSTKAVGEGTGLGLYVSHRIVEDLGGRMWAESNGGKGACVHVVLPATEEGCTDSADLGRRDGPLRLLVVDDEPLLRTLIAELLPEYDVTQASGGRQATQAIGEQRFDLVICDLIMPDLTGMDVGAWVRERHPELFPRMLFMTGAAYTADASAFLASGVRHLHKPFTRRELRRALEDITQEVTPARSE